MSFGFATLARPVSATKRIVIYWVGVSLSFLTAALFSFHGGLPAPENSPAGRGISALAGAVQPRLVASYGKLPLSFEVNQGQSDRQVKFLSRGRGYTLFLTGDEAVLELQESGVRSQNPEVRNQKSEVRNRQTLSMLGRSSLPHSLPPKEPSAPLQRTTDNRPRTTNHRRRTTDHGQRTKSLIQNPKSKIQNQVVRLRLVGANPNAVATGAEELPGKANYFIGNDPKKWRTNVPTYAKVRYQNVYPGIDLVYYGNQGGQLEYDFVVAPGADPGAITLDVGAGSPRRLPAPQTRGRPEGWPLRIAGDAAGRVGSKQKAVSSGQPKIDRNGDLVVRMGGDDEVRFYKPVVYQEQDAGFGIQDSGATDPQQDSGFGIQDSGTKGRQRGVTSNRKSPITNHKSVEGHFHLGANNQVTFEVSAYDKTRPLVIDPVLAYSTYLGGSVQDAGAGIAVDSSGNAYVTGGTYSTDFPTVNPFQANLNGGQTACTQGGSRPCSDAFVTKLNAGGSALVYSTYLGGRFDDEGFGIAVDSSGNAYVTGRTCSPDFPLASPLQPYNHGGCNAFVAKLNPSGSALVYSTYLGGEKNDLGHAIAVDSSGNVYVTGETDSQGFPTVNPVQASLKGPANVFVSELSASGSALVYSTFLGGSGDPSFPGSGDIGEGIAVDSSGGAYVTGFAFSRDFPTTPGAFQTVFPASSPTAPSAFVAKLNWDGSALSLAYSTYFGGSGGDGANCIAVDSSGNAYFAGATGAGLPLINPFQANLGGSQNAFVAELNASGNAAVYSTYLGGSGGDAALGIAIDSSGDAYATGWTESTDFPTVNPIQARNNSAPSFTGFVAELNASDSALVYSTYLGGSGGDQATGIALDASGDAYVIGFTDSADFPTVNPMQASNKVASGSQTAFVAKLAAGPAPAVSFSTPALNFGGVIATATSPKRSVTVANLGNASLSITGITASGDFALVTTAASCPYGGGAVAPEANCTIDVTFTPTAAGARTGTVTVTDNAAGSPHTVQLDGTGVVGAPNISPTNLSFNNQLVGSTSTPQVVTLTNPSSVALSISSLTISSGWTESDNCLPSVAGSASCTINVSFQPTASGYQTGTLTLTDNAVNSPQTVNLSGWGLAPAVSLSSPSLSFAAQPVLTSSTLQTLTLTNTGSGALTPLTITTTGDFAQTNTCAGSVAAGASCTISVTFTPTAPGNRTGTLTLTDNSANSPQTVPLSGTGVLSANVSPTGLSFGSQLVGTASTPQAVTLANTSLLALAISGLTISSGWTQNNNCSPSVAPNSSCTINVSFQPTAVGYQTGTLTLTDNASNSPQTVNLNGTGLAPVVSLSTTSLSFTGQAISTPSAPQTVTLTNTGAGALTPLTITTTGDFAQADTCAGSVAPGANCTISVTFTPTAVGNRTGTLTLTDNAGNSPQTVALSGTGLGTVASLSASSLTFANQLVGTASSAQPVTLQNTGNQALSITSISLTGANSGDFSLGQNCGSSLAANTSCQISVTFTPTARGTRTAAVSLVDNAADSPQSIALSGTGIAPVASLSPTSLTFPGQFVGTTGLPENVTLTNNGDVALSISSIQTSAQFGATNGCTTSLAAGVGCTISVFFDPASAGTQTGTLTITDNAPDSPQTVQLSGTGQDFQMSSSGTSDTVSAGQTANYSLTLAPEGGLNQTVSLTCSGTPSLATCALSPSSVTLNGTASAAVTVQVTTTAGSLAPPWGRVVPPDLRGLGGRFWLVALLGLASVGALAGARRRRAAYLLGACLLLVMLWSACGGGGQVVHTPGTPPGTYTLDVKATVTSTAMPASLTHDFKFTLTVD